MFNITIIICILIISALATTIIMKILESTVHMTPALHAQYIRRQQLRDNEEEMKSDKVDR